MRIFKRCAAFIVAFFLVEELFTFLLEPVTFEHFLNYDIREMNRNHDSAELAFFGDSRAIRTYNPEIFEWVLSGDIEGSINEGVNQQHIISTYYYMKDFLRHNDVKCAVVNLNYEYFLNTTEEPVEAKGITFDRIKSPLGMAEFIWKRFKVSEYPNILKSYRYRWQVKNIEDNLRRKTTKEYWEGTDIRPDIHYVSKGYATWNLTYAQGNTGTPAGVQPWTESVVNEETLDYMDKMVKLCHENDVEIVFVESPMTIGRMYAIRGYEQFEETVRGKCIEMDVPFYSLNLLKKENLSVDDTNFTDTEHMNDKGSTKASERLAEILREQIEGRGTSAYFYQTFDEMNAAVAQIGACDLFVWDTDTQQEEIEAAVAEQEEIQKTVNIQEEENSETLGDCKLTAGKLILQAVSYEDSSITPLYKFSMSIDGGTSFTELQDYGTQNIYEVDKSILNGLNQEDIKFRVDAKPQEGTDLHHCYMERGVEE